MKVCVPQTLTTMPGRSDRKVREPGRSQRRKGTVAHRRAVKEEWDANREEQLSELAAGLA